MRKHIEAHHLNGVSIPCSQCEKTFRSRSSLSNVNAYPQESKDTEHMIDKFIFQWKKCFENAQIKTPQKLIEKANSYSSNL